MDKIRILYCIDTVGRDAGTERQLADLIPRLDKSRFDVHLCCFEESLQLPELARHCTPLVLPLVSVYTVNGFRQIRRLRRYIKEHRIDIVHTFMIKANIFGVLAARKAGCKIVASRRNLGYWFTPFYLRFFRLLARWTTRLLANSETVKRFVVESEKVRPQKVDVLYNGVDLGRYAAERGDPAVAAKLGVPENAKVVGIVANYRPVKDLILFLLAAKVIAHAVKDAAFLLVGQGPQRDELGRMANELGLADRVFFTDGRGAVVDYLARMSVGCLTSETEGFSNAILEYMAAGLPVVATDVGGNAEAVENGVTGCIVRSRSPRDFAAPVIELLNDEPKRLTMGRRSLERCRKTFEIGVAMRRLQDYYEVLAALK